MIALDEKVRMELLKLLVEIAWSDEQLHLREVEVLRRVALALGLEAEERMRLERWLNHMEPMPPPNLQLLKAHRESVMRTATAVVRADGVVSAEERQIMGVLNGLLDRPM